MKSLKKFWIVPVVCAFVLSSCSAGVNKSQNTVDSDYRPTLIEKGIGDESTKDNINVNEIAKENSGTVTNPADRMLEKTFSLSFQTTSYNDDYAFLMQTLKANEGYVSASDTQVQNTQEKELKYSTFEIKVPVANADSFIESIKGKVGTVIHESSNTYDHTDSYHDVETQIKNTESKLEALRELYKKAVTMEDIITVQTEIMNTEQELALYKQSQVEIERRVSYSTINLVLEEVFTIEEAASQSPDFGARVARAFNKSLTGIVDFFQGFVISLVLLWPVLLLIGLIVGLIIFLQKKSAKKRAARKALMPAQPGNATPPQMQENQQNSRPAQQEQQK